MTTTYPSRVIKFDVAGYDGYLTVVEDGQGRPREVFVKIAKEGSTLSGFARAWAIAVSVGLRQGVLLADYIHACSDTAFEPRGVAQLGDAPPTEASSLVAAWCMILSRTYASGAAKAPG